jgi:hypothetical protein
VSERYKVGRAPLHLFLLGLAGVLLLVAALDIVWLHQVSAAPLVDDAGAITTRGRAWQRTDLIWGSVFIVAGLGMLGIALVGLARGRPRAEMLDEGVRLRIGGRRPPITIPWSDVEELRSARVPGEGRHPRPQILIEVADPTKYPYDIWGAEWIGNVLHVDADSWSAPPEEFAVRAEIELARVRRHADDAEVDAAAGATSVAGGDEPAPGTVET